MSETISPPLVRKKLPNATGSTGDIRSNAAERPRLQLDFTPEAFAHLSQMKTRTKAKSTAEVARNAIRLYEWYLEKQSEGYELLLAREGEVRAVELLL